MKKRAIRKWGNRHNNVKQLKQVIKEIRNSLSATRVTNTVYSKLIMDIAHLVHNNYGDISINIDRYTPGDQSLLWSVNDIISEEKRKYQLLIKHKIL